MAIKKIRLNDIFLLHRCLATEYQRCEFAATDATLGPYVLSSTLVRMAALNPCALLWFLFGLQSIIFGLDFVCTFWLYSGITYLVSGILYHGIYRSKSSRGIAMSFSQNLIIPYFLHFLLQQNNSFL